MSTCVSNRCYNHIFVSIPKGAIMSRAVQARRHAAHHVSIPKGAIMRPVTLDLADMQIGFQFQKVRL